MAARFLLLSVLAVLSAGPAVGQIGIGEAAPPLHFTQLLQAPPGARADWASLRGKVVVLEFWATWCAPCIEQIPHLNSVIRSVGASAVQFIAIDDEAPETVEKFAANMPIGGWLGMDTTGTTLRAYGAETRPRTVVVDREGRIAGTLDPTQLTGAALLNLVAGRRVAFPVSKSAAMHEQVMDNAARLDAMASAGGSALFDVSVRRGEPRGAASIVNNSRVPDGPVHLDVINMPLAVIISFMGLPLDRVQVIGFPPDRYTLHVAAPSGTLEQLGTAIQMAVASAAGMHLVRTHDEEDVWVLQATPRAGTLLPAATGKGQICMVEPRTRKLILEGCPLDQFAERLEDYLGTPVLNETGISGRFSEVIPLAAPGAEALQSALQQNAGLTLVRARRPVERVTLEP